MLSVATRTDGVQDKIDVTGEILGPALGVVDELVGAELARERRL